MRWEPITRFIAGNRAVSEWVVTASLAGGWKSNEHSV